ncbi:hypothetical protein Salat_2424400 [Sesamum alatum]|uniref:Uncharacterized protein n=1 Tax=Sesamum alatum TaxID=300844 RepID=A0AAE1XY05_9LAMI|nr:hypothetical protein Salat_2424400 [Sesamum alatum]
MGSGMGRFQKMVNEVLGDLPNTAQCDAGLSSHIHSPADAQEYEEAQLNYLVDGQNQISSRLGSATKEQRGTLEQLGIVASSSGGPGSGIELPSIRFQQEVGGILHLGLSSGGEDTLVTVPVIFTAGKGSGR